jgi:hypothetical protein
MRQTATRRRVFLAALALSATASVLAGWFRQPAPHAPVAAKVGTSTLRMDIFAGGRAAPNTIVGIRLGDAPRRDVRTDERGHLELGDCPRTRLAITVDVPGAARVRHHVDLSSGSASVRIDLEPGNVVRGRVHDESDRPVANATVTARIIGDDAEALKAPWTVASTSDGSFAIDTLPKARITLEVSDAQQHESAVIAEVPVPSSAVVDVLLRRTAGLNGRVLSAERTPVVGAPVMLAGSGIWPTRMETSNDQGEFAFAHVPEGVYEVRAELNGNVSAPIEGIAVSPGNTARVELVLQPGLVLRGSVLDIATGEPLSAQLEIVEESLSAAPKHAQTDRAGRFEVTTLRPIAQRVTVRAAGYVTEQRALPPATEVLKLALLRAVTMTGSVQDADGRPVPLVELEVSGRSETGYAVRMVGPINEAPEPAPATTNEGAQASTASLGVTYGALPKVPLAGAAPGPLLGELGFHSDEHGRFRLEGLPPGNLVVAGHKLGFGAGRSRALQARAGASIEDVLIVLPRAAALSGRVVDSHATPVAHVRVDATCAAEAARSTVSSERGEFRFDAVRGPCSVQARPVGAPVSQIDVSAADVGHHELELVLESATERLSGRVLDSRERPIEAASVHLETGHGRSFSATAVSAADGTFEFDALPVPPYTLRAEHADYTPSAPLAIGTGAVRVIVRLEAGADLEGVVVGSSDQAALAHARLTLQVGELARTARTNHDGTFEFRHVPTGHCSLLVQAERHVPKRVECALGASHGPAFERVLLDRAGAISGDVVDRLGATVWNAEVAALTPPDWTAAVRTDHAGHFELPDLPAGEHPITARYDGEQVSSANAVRVYQGEVTRGVVLRLNRVVDATQEPLHAGQTGKPSVRVDAALTLVLHDGAVEVAAISPSSAAARSGLAVGDLLISVDGEPVRSPAQARGMLGSALAGRADRVLQVSRAGTPLQLHLANGP